MPTYLQIRTDAQAMALSSDDTTASRIANEVYAEVVAAAKINPKIATKDLSAGQQEYDVATDWLLPNLQSIDYLLYYAPGATTYDVLERTDLGDVLERNRGFGYGYVQGYAMRNRTKIVLEPIPQGNDSVTIYYQDAPTDMSADGDEPSLIDPQWQYLVTWGTAARLAQAEGPDLAMQLEAQFRAKLVEFTQWVEKRQGMVQRRIRWGYHSRPVRHDRSQDIR